MGDEVKRGRLERSEVVTQVLSWLTNVLAVAIESQRLFIVFGQEGLGENLPCLEAYAPEDQC